MGRVNDFKAGLVGFCCHNEMETTPCDSDLDLDLETRTPLRHEPWGQQLGIGSEFFIIGGRTGVTGGRGLFSPCLRSCKSEIYTFLYVFGLFDDCTRPYGRVFFLGLF